MWGLTFFASSASRIKFLTHSVSEVPCPIAYSSASPEESAIVPCVLAQKPTGQFRSLTITPEVDFEFAGNQTSHCPQNSPGPECICCY